MNQGTFLSDEGRGHFYPTLTHLDTTPLTHPPTCLYSSSLSSARAHARVCGGRVRGSMRRPAVRRTTGAYERRAPPCTAQGVRARPDGVLRRRRLLFERSDP
jgi:hypothetical protein